jgi:putative oxidoreductase
MDTTVTSSSPAQQSGRTLSSALWVLQLLLGVAFAFGGGQKIATPIHQLSVGHMSWAADVPAALVRFIGVAEVTGGIGLILPSVTRIKPWLTPLAGLGLITILLLAAAFHATRGEVHAIPGPLVLGAALAFVTWGRFRRAPIAPRNAQ